LAHSPQRRWYPLVFTIAALVLLPLSVLLSSWQTVDQQIWSHLWETQMPRLLGNTLTLVLGVGLGVTVLGVSLAWLTALCEFPGRRWLDWALMLPFAIPAYVLAFVFVDCWISQVRCRRCCASGSAPACVCRECARPVA
jgi:iron(III) transport system permease protein